MGKMKLFKHINASFRCVTNSSGCAGDDSDSICNIAGINSLNDDGGLSLTRRLGISSNNLRNVFNAPIDAQYSLLLVVVVDVVVVVEAMHCNINGINSTQFLIQNAFILFSK
jgi:hypothetical protein